MIYQKYTSHGAYKYSHPDDWKLKEKRRRLVRQRNHHQKRYRLFDMMIHALDTTLAIKQEKRNNEQKITTTGLDKEG